MPGSLLVPNEDGVLVPVEADVLEPASETERVLSLAANSGGSGEGMSHFAQASRCGRRARLSQERYSHFAESSAPLPSSKNHFVIGSVYHKLQELARRKHNYTLDYNEQFANPNVAEGVRLYKGWLRHWGLDYWGECLGVEVHLTDDKTFMRPLEDNDPFPPEKFESLGDWAKRADTTWKPICVTGALDMVVDMDWEACERARKRGLDLTPGRRIIDWKTADGPSDGTQYAEGLQALWYCHLWNLHNPETPVDGIIFDVIYKRSRRKDRTVLADDFGAHYVPYGMESVDVLRGMVMQGHYNITADRPNRSECVTWRGEICPFRTHGQCDAT